MDGGMYMARSVGGGYEETVLLLILTVGDALLCLTRFTAWEQSSLQRST
jgi:hypothetical protein